MRNKLTLLLVSCLLVSGIWFSGNGQTGTSSAVADAQAELDKCWQELNDLEIRVNNLQVLVNEYYWERSASTLSKDEKERVERWREELMDLTWGDKYGNSGRKWVCLRITAAEKRLNMQVEESKKPPSPTPTPSPTPVPYTGPPIIVEDPNTPNITDDEVNEVLESVRRIDPLSAEINDWVKKRKAELPPSKPIDGLRSNIDWQPSLQVIRIDTPVEVITVSLPDGIRAGDSLSGTVFAEPKVREPGKNETRDPDAPQLELIRTNPNGLTEYFRIPTIKYYVPGRFADGGGASGTVKTYDVGTALGTFTCTLTIVSPNGKEILLIPLQTNSEPATKTGTSADLKLPTLGQAGRNQSITGTFDGNAGSTNVSIAGKPVEVIAESPRKCVFRAPADAVGPSEITVNENGRETKGTYRNVGVKLTAPKTNLMKGEKTTLTVQVTGLAGIINDVPLQLEKTGTVAMQDGDMQHMQIRPQDVDRNGVFTLTRAITGVKPGGFNVTATVHDPTRRPVIIPLTDGARTNGYRVTGSGSNAGLEIENVIDPVTGKPVNGRHKLQAGCGQPVLANLPVLGFLFKNGNASMKKTECLAFITPKIIIE